MENEKLIDQLSEEEQFLLKAYYMINKNGFLKKLADDLFSQPQFKEKQTRKISQDIENGISSILSKEELSLKVSLPTRIYFDGVFDIIHSGHFNALRQAKKLGDILVVGVNSDEDVFKAKGPTILNDSERAALAKACKWVDEVHSHTPYTPNIKLLDDLNCKFCAHGDDMPTNENGQDCYMELKEAGRMKVFRRTEGISTTEIIGRLLTATKNRVITKEDDSIKGSELLSRLSSFDKSPAISNLLTTGWRLVEFLNNRSPKLGSKVVYIDGDFDILHGGYLETLEKAKALGDFLYVGVHDDTVVNSYKGHNYPILNLQERILNLIALKYVDDVIIAAPLKISEVLIKSLGINIFVIGNDQEKCEISDAYDVPLKLGLTVEIKSEILLNNDIFIERIEKNRQNYSKKFERKRAAEEKYEKNNTYEIQEI